MSWKRFTHRDSTIPEEAEAGHGLPEVAASALTDTGGLTPDTDHPGMASERVPAEARCEARYTLHSAVRKRRDKKTLEEMFLNHAQKEAKRQRVLEKPAIKPS